MSRGIIKNDLLFGFCVWGSSTIPTKEDGCLHSPVNSHIVAFIIDVIMTGLAGIFSVKDQSEKKSALIYIATAFIILAHGMLHWFLQQEKLDIVVNCYNPDLVGDIEEVGTILFAAFSFFLALIILGIGFGGIRISNIVFSAIFAAIVVVVTENSGGENKGELVLPGLFVIVHPLSSITGLFSDDPSFNKTVARLFVVCTFVGILELSLCTNILKPIGGHLWYDVTLHSAVLASLPYIYSPAAKGKKD